MGHAVLPLARESCPCTQPRQADIGASLEPARKLRQGARKQRGVKMRIAITGAATGIGAATVQRLKVAGHEVVAFDIAQPASVDRWVPLDLGDLTAARQAAAAEERLFDALINNAGIPPRDGNAQAVLRVNTLGLVAFTEALLPRLRPGGAIVSTASRAGFHWQAGLAQVKELLALPGPEALAVFIARHQMDAVRAYCLSKEAVIAWTIGQTERWLAQGLRGNTVSPSGVSTDILDDFRRGLGEKVDRALARAGRAATADEVAAALVFLADPQSSWIKGQDIVIDGGLTAFGLSDALELDMRPQNMSHPK
jgi:NAD(P)-dependent dehydrogenase (short-subunit alcohol dehydrogenase family)